MSHKAQLEAIAEARLRLSIDPVTGPDKDRLDAYFAAKHAEIAAIKPPAAIMSRESILSTNEDGTVFVKPPRSMHRSRIVRILDRITRWIDPQA